MIQQSHSWAYIQRKLDFKKINIRLCYSSTIHNDMKTT